MCYSQDGSKLHIKRDIGTEDTHPGITDTDMVISVTP